MVSIVDAPQIVSIVSVVRCFVIGPIGDQLAEQGTPDREIYEDSIQVFEEVVKAACRSLNIEAYRSDDIDQPGEIPEQVFEALRDEELVIADLTGANPNVMYELGIRHALGKCTIQIGEKGRLPFDINTIRTVQFLRTPTGFIKARTALTKMIDHSLAHGCGPSTAGRIVGMALSVSTGTGISTPDPGRPEIPPSLPHGGESGRDDPALEEPLGFLDALAAVESETPEMTERLQSMGDLIREMGLIAVEATEETDHVTKATQRLAIVRRFSAKFADLVRDYDKELVEFEGRTSTIGAAVDVVLDHVERTNDRSDFIEYLSLLVQLSQGAAESRDGGIRGFASSIAGIENLSRDVRPSARLLLADIDRTVRAFDEVERWGVRASELIVPNDAPASPGPEGPD